MKILVPTDFSDNARHAATYAATLANAKPGSGIHLLHVLTSILNDPLVIGDIAEEAVKSLGRISAQLKATCPACSITHSIKIGETVAEIDRAANDLNVGLIVMGLQGLGKTSRFFFGSNSRSLINKATCPVLVIPERSTYSIPEKIVFATDYYDSDLDSLVQLVAIAKSFDSEIIMVHIFDESDEEQSEASMINFISNQIFKTVTYPRLTYRVYYDKDTAHGIKKFCESTEADLVVVSARKQNLYQKLFGKSITKELVYETEIPLLVFHVDKTENIAGL